MIITRTASIFDKISSSLMANLVILIDPSLDTQHSITVTAPERLHEKVSVESRDSTLILKTVGRYTVEPHERFFVTVCVRRLIGIDNSGMGKASISGVSGDTFVLEDSAMGSLELDSTGPIKSMVCSLSGHGSVNLRNLRCESLKIHSSAMGSLKASGKSVIGDLRVDGMGSSDLSELEVRDLELNGGGMGSLRLHCTNSFRGMWGGMGSVRVFGKPSHVSLRSTGMGSVRFA
jgi:hypothetical protein